jgi:hypothetical protein
VLEVYRLEQQRSPQKFTSWQLEELIKVYKAKIKELENADIVGALSECG